MIQLTAHAPGHDRVLCRVQAKYNQLTDGGSKSKVFVESFTSLLSQLADIVIVWTSRGSRLCSKDFSRLHYSHQQHQRIIAANSDSEIEQVA